LQSVLTAIKSDPAFKGDTGDSGGKGEQGDQGDPGVFPDELKQKVLDLEASTKELQLSVTNMIESTQTILAKVEGHQHDPPTVIEEDAIVEKVLARIPKQGLSYSITPKRK